MPTPQRHFKDELQDWLDGRLDAETCSQVERHVETCAECRREYEAMWWTKRFAAKEFAAPEAPVELRGKILQSLRAEDSRSDAETEAPAFWRRQLRPVLAMAAGVIVAAILALNYFLKHPQLPEVVARDFRAYQAQQLALELSTGDVKAMEVFFAGHGVPFKTRVFDLGMMNYQLVGGSVRREGGAPRAVFVYRGPGNRKLVCEMFEGRVETLPKGAILRQNKGISFYVYETGGMTAVFWREGTVICALVSDITPEEVVQLAFAKAMP
jgi:anti-sigma factor (TIGR02949 family)